ncbi:MAG: hypothetical protein GY880_18690, partial [Planctomycetaceae bacterium]|nr:hypothetical protein [Planctomycetaceae bacterium]
MKELRHFEDFIIAVIGDGDASKCAEIIEAGGGITRPFLLSQKPDAREQANEFANRILTADIDTVIFVTGVGVRAIIDQASKSVDQQRFLDCLADIHTVAGSQSAVNALQEFEITPKISVHASHSWRDILIALDRSFPVVNQSIALEESESIYS